MAELLTEVTFSSVESSLLESLSDAESEPDSLDELAIGDAQGWRRRESCCRSILEL